MVLTSISDIERLDRDAQAALEWAPVPLGSILRTHAYSFRNWRFDITPENAEWLYERSAAAYSCEWRDTDSSVNALIAEGSRNAGLSDTNALMNAKIGEYAASHAAASGDPVFTILDIGAGVGGTSRAVLERLAGLGMGLGIELMLLEPSEKRMAEAEQAAKGAVMGTPLENDFLVRAVLGPVSAVGTLNAGSASMIVTNAAIHHESFNAHLPLIRRALADDGVFISGDWHESNYEHPARVYWIYHILHDPYDERRTEGVAQFALGRMMPFIGPEHPGLAEFRKLFGLETKDLLMAYDNHTESERRAAVGSIRYWAELGKKFVELGKKCPEHLLQCHERVSKRMEALKNAGFVFDDECRSKYVEVIKDRGFGELAAVMVAKKSIKR
ncbi:MAG: class I SAM-dependent methyltransferase [Candidatus Micrarchaeota archaeon]